MQILKTNEVREHCRNLAKPVIITKNGYEYRLIAGVGWEWGGGLKEMERGFNGF
ncbi:MAG: hypothetical protein FWG87_04000 [Defluviitaleaceae bacterium]|nr:hypothetical protein [Defluviitaleaceae bacterium]